ncbi:MAG: hypothetical protein EOP83_10855 [Verrucomicrobiaceae bacterium]|nr:MAG: hypothetical protein EOP83_10855 [Verrucomicrobiaceae bacterium]
MSRESAMTGWTIAREKKPENEGLQLPETYQTYVIKYQGVIVGRLKHSYRPKNCGGPAWEAIWTHRDHPHMVGGCVGISRFGKDKAKLLIWFREANQRYAEQIVSPAMAA